MEQQDEKDFAGRKGLDEKDVFFDEYEVRAWSCTCVLRVFYGIAIEF